MIAVIVFICAAFLAFLTVAAITLKQEDEEKKMNKNITYFMIEQPPGESPITPREIHNFISSDKMYSECVVWEVSELFMYQKFVAQIERRAEEKMLKTGKLEGAHYAAMKELLEEMEAAGERSYMTGR